MYKYSTVIILIFLYSFSLYSQSKKELEKRASRDKIEEILSITDRAAGTHNASNIGLFFENRGKLYPRRLSQGPSGEYPINSGHNYIYRINPLIGVPGNVVQARYTTNEEWEAVGGYHNRQYSLIAFSDNPSTWDPDLGWPIKDSKGKPVFKSDQDSYCVYSDSNNSRPKLGLFVAQTGYTYGLSFAKNLIFYKFDITNKGAKDLDSVYFNLYTDVDVGDASGGVAEYQDDMLGFNKEKNFVYFYDSKGFSKDWQAPAGYFGVAFLRTPSVNGKELGITDMHYNLYDDDIDLDSVQFGIMSSSPGLYNSSVSKKYFHLGSPPNIHFDDPSTIPATGLDILANVSSGPYKLKRGDPLTFYTAILAGESLSDITNTLNQANTILNFDFEIAKPPAAPVITGYAGDGRALIYWDDKAEYSYDKFSGVYDFEGYRLYRSMDKGVTWDKIADYDVPDKIGLNAGLQYAFIDSTVTNGFEYWYSITSFDRGDSSLASLESSRGNTLASKNIFSSISKSTAIGRKPVSVSDFQRIGMGKSNYQLKFNVVDDESLKNNEYKIGFTYTGRTESGKLKTKLSFTVSDSTKTKPYRYGILFKSSTLFDLVNLTTGESIKEDNTYRSGATYSADGIRIKIEDPDPRASSEFLPKAGDYLSMNFSVFCVRNNTDTVISPRTFLFDKLQATSDGIIFSMSSPKDSIVFMPSLQDAYRFKISGSSIVKEEISRNISNIKVVPNPYVVSSLFEPEFGDLRREPLRQIQFTNLPNECTIYVFSVNADLVKTLRHSSINGTEAWDLRSESGREIAPGIYIYVVDANGAKFKSKFAVIK
jgi:hypothetical protein